MHVILFQKTTTTIHILGARTNSNSLRKARRLSRDHPFPRAHDVNNKNRVRLRRVYRAISPLSFVNRIERRELKEVLH